MSAFALRHCWAFLVLSLFVGCEEPIPDHLESGLDFRTEMPSFSNYADNLDGWQLNVDGAVKLFGAEAVCVPGSSPCQPTELALAWMEDVNQTLTHGHSEGIALFTLALHHKKRAVADFGAESAAALDLSDERVKQEIAYWAATQKIPAALSADRSFQAKDVMRFLATALKPGQPDGWRLALVMKDYTGFKGGHALVPFGFFKGKQDGQYWLRVFDSNWPNKEQRVFIDTRTNTWSYDGSQNAAAPRRYEGNATNGNLLYFSPLSAHEGPFVAPFSEGARSLLVSANGAGITLRDQGGAEVGLGADGVLVERGGAVRPAFAQSNCVLCPGPAEVVNYTLSPDGGMAGSQTISLSNFGNASADGGTVNITAPGATAKLTGVRTEQAGASIELAGKSMTYASSESSTPTTVTLNVAGPNGSTVRVTVSLGSSPLGQVKIDASNPNDVKVTATSQTGQTVSGNVVVQVVNADGTGKVTTMPIDIKNGKTTTATVDAVSGAATVVPAAGTACENGRRDLTLADGGTTGGETDVDCGGLCPPCASMKRCAVAADCASKVCSASVCQEPTCFDRVKNGTETDVDCGGSCFGTCRQGQVCNAGFECATMTGSTGSVCFADPDGGVSRCQSRLRRTLRVTGLGAGASYNLNGTMIDGQRQDDWIVNGVAGGVSTVPFESYRYDFQQGGARPAPRQGNFTCSLTNPTNDPALIAQGRGDGGEPLLACTLTGSTMSVRATGCWGMSVPFSATLDGVTRQVQLPINNLSGYGGSEGVGSMEIGSFRTSARFAPPGFGSRTFDMVGDAGRRQTCPGTAVNSPFGDTTGLFQVDYACTCDVGDFRGPTSTGNPCTGAVDRGTLVNYSFQEITGDTSVNSVNNFIFPADAGCGGHPTPSRSGSDRVFKFTIPAGLDLLANVVGVGAPQWRAQLSLITSLAACGTNGPTAATTGTSGVSCVRANKTGTQGYSAIKYHNSTGAPLDVWLVIDGEDFGEAGPFRLSVGALPHRDTVTGNPCALLPPLNNNANYNQSNPSGYLWANNFVFSPAATGCATKTSPAMSGIDRQYRLSVPAMTQLSVTFPTSGSTCNVVANLVEQGACGSNAGATGDLATTGISCVASSLPRSNVFCSPRPPMVYENRTSSAQNLWLVLEAASAEMGDPDFSFTLSTSALPSAPINTPSGPAYLGNPCTGATFSSVGDALDPQYVQDFGPYYLGPVSQTLYSERNNVSVKSSLTCAAPPVSGPDVVQRYSLAPGYELRVTARANELYVGTAAPFVLHAVAGQANCGQNGTDYLDAGTIGVACAATTAMSATSQSLSYTNTSSAVEQVYVLFEGTRASSNGYAFSVTSQAIAPSDGGTDGGTTDAGTADAGQDAGTDAGQDAGPADAGTPDAGAPDAGTPDAGQDAGQDAGPADAGAPACSSDSQCASNNCYCSGEPGRCLGLGRCVPGLSVLSTATTDGTTASGTFTVPAGCTQVHVFAWGAGGGQSQQLFPVMLTQSGGAGGHVSGLLSAAPGDVFTVWVGGGGHNGTGITGDEGRGSYFGTAANGGLGDSAASCGGGGGLTSIRQTGSATRQFTVPAGGGASAVQPGQPAGGMGAGSATTQSGGNAGSGTEGGGGGAGEPGGLGCSTFQTPGDPGAYGMLPAGLTSQNGMLSGNPAQTGIATYQLCPSTTGVGAGGNGCVVLRCTTP